jgi:malate synthase
VFDRVMPTPNQLSKKREDVSVKAADLLAFAPQTPITEQGLRTNINVSLQYIGSWLGGNGCVPINHLMEDAATAEISRSQLWHWRTRGVALTDGRDFDADLYAVVRDEELARLGGAAEGRLSEAAGLLDRLVLDDDFAEFLTLRAYSLLD